MSIQSVSIFFVFLVLFSSGACRRENNIVNIQANWSSMNPKTIPLNLREKEQQKGNLVLNPSFELGRYYLADTVRLSFNLPGWKKVGDNVFWTDIQKTGEFDYNEASNGIHAIKIIRKNANETDTEGEGIFSDYIRVIPGNYQLSMDIKLWNIESNLERLIDHIYDAVNISLFFYDKNKVMIKSHAYHPVFDRWIDNSFKAVPLSNYKYINEFDWARIIARSGNFPFAEGYIPDEARYVRIFAGLKGTGTMWVDMVDFRYGNENFTFLEKTESFFDSTLERSRLLIPEPQLAELYHPINLIKDTEAGEELKPLILLPVNADLQMKNLVSLLVQELKEKEILLPSENPVVSNVESRDIESGRLIINLGNTVLTNQYADQLSNEDIKDKRQACYLRRISSLGNIIFVDYSDDQGLFRAINIIRQLCDAENNLYHHYDITDFPDFITRALILPVKESDNGSLTTNDLNFLALSGINEFIIEPKAEDLGATDFISIALPAAEMIDDMNSELGFINKGFSFLNLRYGHLNLFRSTADIQEEAKAMDAARKDAESHSDMISALSSKSSDIMLFNDQGLWDCMDFGPVHSSFKQLSVAELNNYIKIRNAYWNIIAQNPVMNKDHTLYIQPLISNNRVKNQVNILEYMYFRNLEQRHSGFKGMIWTGPAYQSFLIDDVDYQLYKDDHNLQMILLDNSLLNLREEIVALSYNSIYPGVMSTGILFDPYRVQITKKAREGLNSECIINLNKTGEFDFIRAATAADYLWNVRDYDPFISTWKVLVERYGRNPAKDLVYFNDYYYGLLSICMQLEQAGYNQKLVKAGDELQIKLNMQWESLKTTFHENINLLNLLSDYKNGATARYMQAKQSPAMNEEEDGS